MLTTPPRSSARRLRAAATASVLLLAASLAACSSSDDSGGDDEADSIKVWIQEDLPDRVAATQKIVDAFTADTGVEVELVPVAEDQFNQLLTSSAAAGDLPDVIGGVSLPQVRTMSANELLDTDATAEVMDGLDEATFSPSALELTRDGDTQLAVPSESWTQILLYRQDLFDKAGLEAPTSYDTILAAAEALDSPDMAGFVGANIAGDAFTEQTFEHVALGNGCELVDEEGEVTLDSDACVESFEFYGDLVGNYSVSGGQDVDTTRASYFAGQAAMTIWSTFILDEMAGLRNDALPTCPECKKDPGFLAENTGVVTSIAGPSGTAPAVFGEITSWVIPVESAAGSAQDFVDYLMNDGYLPWIAIAPEGKVPVRAGTSESPTEFSDAWAGLDVGVDTKAPLAEFYGDDVLTALTTGPEQLARWAIPQGQGDLLGAIQGEHPVATAVNEVTDGGDPADAATKAADAVRSIQESLQ
ncbi:Extracellular solute-binding protein family 1 [metagenome]|uniref:Extracellular solute-binding protein family 1 n=1 Tax=metagenome TaxID=256318 RepID=A0A2P2CEM1_9ZZZZ